MLEGYSSDDTSDSDDDSEDEIVDDDWLNQDEPEEEDGGGDKDSDGSSPPETVKEGDDGNDTDDDDGQDWTELETLRAVLHEAKLSAQHRSDFVNALQRESFKPGDYIVHQGDHGDSFYIVTKGEVVVTKTLDGEEDERTFQAVGLVVDGISADGTPQREGVLTKLY